MAEVVNLPKLGFDMHEGTFLNWVKQVGEMIHTGDVLAEIEADKATIEVESTASGVLLETLVNAGDVVPVGAPIAMVGAAGESGNGTNGAAPAPVAAAADANVPDQTPAHEEQAESTAAADNQTTPVAVQSAPAAPAAPAAEVDEDLPGGVKASPLARRVADERHIDLRQVNGTGPNGRITRADVEGYQPAAQAPAPATPATAATAAAPVTTKAAPAPVTAALTPAAPPASAKAAPSGPGVTEMPLTRLRQRIASRMVESKQTVPHFYVTTEIDMAAAMALRKQINEPLDEAHKISVNDMVVKAVALALREFPNLNTHFYGDKLIRYEHINIGIAVALDGGGLMNVVAKDADSTSISRLAARNKTMIAGARAGKVKPDDVEGSTFTVSNLGAFDVESFVAIINPPEAGIIAVGSARQIPVVVNGELTIGTRMKCTLSVDHRVSDGAEGAQFMQLFKRLLEQPMRLLV